MIKQFTTLKTLYPLFIASMINQYLLVFILNWKVMKQKLNGYPSEKKRLARWLTNWISSAFRIQLPALGLFIPTCGRLTA